MHALIIALGVLLLAFVAVALVEAAQVRSVRVTGRRELDRLRRQIGDLERSREQLEHLSMTDPLTGVSNYRFLQLALDRELARANRDGVPLALLLVDIDGFRDVNRRHGHQRGGAVLRQIAERIGLELRPTDVLARYGGEEFVILLHDTAQATAEDVAGRICYAVRRQVFGDHTTAGATAGTPGPDGAAPNRGALPGQTADGADPEDTGSQSAVGIRVTVSIGIATRPPTGPHAAALLRAADGALAEAKEAGGDRWATSREPAGVG